MLSTQTLVNNLVNAIINPLMLLLFSAGLLVFFWGVIEFLLALNVNGSTSKEDGKQHMLWGLIGMFVMVSAYAILGFIASNVCNGTVKGC
ncbi:MAG: hypothetical protein ABSE76_03575 [Minisyncoccia bacterium]|jgi:hypothetical protein